MLHEGNGVFVGVGELVGVRVTVGVRVIVGVRVGVRVAVFVGVFVMVAVWEGVKLGVGEFHTKPPPLPPGFGCGKFTICAVSNVSLRPTR